LTSFVVLPFLTHPDDLHKIAQRSNSRQLSCGNTS